MPHNRFITSSASTFLDLMRIIASELVVIGHTFWFTDALLSQNGIIREPRMLLLSHLGVVLFFILSGLLISYSVFIRAQQDSYNFRIFLIDRFARIYSGLVPCFLFIYAVNHLHVHLDPNHFMIHFGNINAMNVRTMILDLFMLQGFPFALVNVPIEIPTFGNAFPLWTLNVEWWLYLSFGWLFLGLTRGKSLTDPAFAIPLVFFSIIPLTHLIYQQGLLIIAWYVGVLITVLLMHAPELPLIRNNHGAGAAVLVILIGLRLQTGKEVYSDMVLTALVAVLIIITLSYLNKQQTHPRIEKVSPGIKFMAGYSYSLYLIHFPILSILFSQYPSGESKVAVSLLSIICSNLIAAGIALFTEMHHKRFAAWLKVRFSKYLHNGQASSA